MTMHKLTLLDCKMNNNSDDVMNEEFRMGFVGEEGGGGRKVGDLNWNRTRFDLFSTIRIFYK
jgi:hypothetical protein